MLLPVDLRDWVPEDDLVHFVIEATDRLPLSQFKVNERGTGSAQMPPHMMLALLVYCYCNGIFSSRKIERASYRDIAVRYLTGDHHPDHDTIAKFRRENLGAVSAAFVEILMLARTLGMLKLGKVSTDGTHLKANASIDKNLTYARATALREQLQIDIQELLEQAESADRTSSDEQALPEPIARREALQAKMDQAVAELKERAEGERQAQQEDYEKKVAAREQPSRRANGPAASRVRPAAPKRLRARASNK
jgi:transposase